MGISDRPIEYLVKVAHSWLEPPELKIISKGFVSEGYSKDQRVFLLTKKAAGKANLEFELPASKKSPVFNPGFVIKNWGDADASLTINGRNIKHGRIFRFGHRRTLEGTDLVVWVKKESEQPVGISLSPVTD